MKVENFNGHTFYVSEEIYRERNWLNSATRRWQQEEIIASFSSLPNFADLVSQITQTNRRRNYALLYAHGGNYGRWVYQDNRQIYQVEDWVAEKDGSAAALLVLSCNSGNLLVQTYKSLLVYPMEITSLGDLFDGIASLRVYSPILGDYGVHRPVVTGDIR